MTILTTKAELGKEGELREAADRLHSITRDFNLSELKGFQGNPLISVLQDDTISICFNLGCHIHPKRLCAVGGSEALAELITLEITETLADASAAWEAHVDAT